MALVLSPLRLPIFWATWDMYFDLASRTMMLRKRQAVCNSIFIEVGSGFVGSRKFRRRLVIRSIAGCILSLLISNQAFCSLISSVALDFAALFTSSKKVV